MERSGVAWMTAIAVLVGLFLALEGAGIVESQPTVGQRLMGVIFVGVPGLMLLGGLWALRRPRIPTRVAHSLIVVGLVATVTKFYLVLPVVAGALLLWFGVKEGGLAREAR